MPNKDSPLLPGPIRTVDLRPQVAPFGRLDVGQVPLPLVIEATYQALVVPGFTVQPDAQYVLRPSGGTSNPYNPGERRVRNAAIPGVRATVQY